MRWLMMDRVALALRRGALLLVWAGACSSSPTTGTLIPTEGVVYGAIRDSTGGLQAGAVFEVIPFRVTCTQPNPVLQEVPTVSADGNYRLLLRGPHFDTLLVCLVVNASAQSAAGMLQGTVRDSLLVLRRSGSGSLDSVRVNVIVR